MTSSSAQTALRAGLFQALDADSVLEGLLGAGRLFDVVPHAQAFPYLVLETLESTPLLSDPEEGLEHLLSLAVFSRASGRGEASQAAERARDVLLNGGIAFDGHRFVGLSAGAVSSRLLRDRRTFRAGVSLRAVTEPEAA